MSSVLAGWWVVSCVVAQVAAAQGVSEPVDAVEGPAPDADEHPTADWEDAWAAHGRARRELAVEPGRQVGRALHGAARGGPGAVGQGAVNAAGESGGLLVDAAAAARRVVTEAPTRVREARGRVGQRVRTQHHRNQTQLADADAERRRALARVRKAHKALPQTLAEVVGGTEAAAQAAHRALREDWTGVSDVARGLRDDVRSTGGAWAADAAYDVTHGTAAQARWGADHVTWVATEAAHGVGASVAAAGTVPRRAWRTTVEGVGGTLRALGPQTVRVARAGVEVTGTSAAMVGGSVPVPAQTGLQLARAVTAWNMEHGYRRGWVGGMGAARNAMDHDDPGAAVAFGGASVGKAVWHLLVLQPLLLGGVGALVTGAYGVLLGLGVPMVAHVGVGAALFTAACALWGTLGAGAMALLGTLGTGLASGAMVARVVASVGLGAAWLGAAATGAAASVVGRLGLALGLLGAVPLVTGGMLAALHLGWGGAGALLLGRTAMGTGVVLTGGGLGAGAAVAETGLVTAGQAGRVAAKTAWMSARVAVESAGLPLGAGVDAVRAAGRDPVLAPAKAAWSAVVLAGGAAGAALTLLHGALGWGVLVPTLVLGVASAGTRLGVHTVGLGGRFVGSALNIPQHRAWASYRAEQVAAARDAARLQGVEDAGDVAVVRVAWWGSQAGRVRFFVTRNAAGDRTYFQREVDQATCRVRFRHTQKDPALRLTGASWDGVVDTAVQDERCAEKKASDTARIAAAR